MMKIVWQYVWLALFTLLITVSCVHRKPAKNPSPENELNQLAKEVRANLTQNILPLWSGEMVDSTGGFYGRMDARNTMYKDADRGGIQNARILWTFSAACKALHDSSCLHPATHARDYLFGHFLDPVHGGAFMRISSKGEATDTRKQTYTQAFFHLRP